ncbi:MAG: sensor histidine kinase, partial [Chloroflexota bacterium]
IINELVSNALKHAFSNGRAGQICVELVRNETEQLTLRVSDDGAGFPADVDYRNTTSLGLQLVNTLADQIGGTVELERYPETAFKIVFRPPGLEEKRQ